MRSSRQRDQYSHCLRCFLRREICICSLLPTVQTRTEFIILQHVYESIRPSNTGRLVALAMPNSQIISCGGGNRIGLPLLDDGLLLNPATWLLWPDGPDKGSDIIESARPERVVVLDATWQQARRLYSRIAVLRTLPRLVLPAPAQQRKRLRKQHRSDGMSTIEAVAAALAKLEGRETAEPLEKLYDEVVRRKNAIRWGIRQSAAEDKEIVVSSSVL